MTSTKLARLSGKMIQKMCQASLVAFVSLLTILGGIFQGSQVIKSLVLGIVLWLLPNSLFAVKIWRHLWEMSGKGLLNVFYRAELIKLLISGIFFIMMVKLLSVNIPILLLAYLASQLVFWLLLILKAKKV
jgi:ATP synthase protein I